MHIIRMFKCPLLLLTLLALPIASLAGADHADRQLLILDSDVADGDVLTQQLDKLHIVRVDRSADPLAQIIDALRNMKEIDTVHIVSHGDSGVLLLGGKSIDRRTVEQHTQFASALKHALSGHADILLYGCDVAADAQGRAFVDTLAALTGADVAASSNATGDSKAGADWTLEYASGPVESAIPFSRQTLAGYHHTLSHFRGGSITWQAAALDGDSVKNDVIITVKTAWRYNSINSVSSLASSPALTITQLSENRLYVGGDATLADYALQTTILEARNLDPAITYLVSYTGCCRIGGLLNNANGDWNIQAEIYMQGGNLAPKIDLPIIFEVPQLQSDGVTTLVNWTFDLGSTDPNADKLRYRLANLTELGGGSSTNPTGLSINPNTGLITWSNSGNLTSGLYSGGIVAEDVNNSGNPKSKTHVDFILDLQPKASVGFTPSANIPETRNVIVEKGTTYSFSISGTAIETTSLGDVQGALTEPTEGNFIFDPGIVGAGLLPGAYPITFEISDNNDVKGKSYLVLNFIVPDPDAPKIVNLEADRTTYSSTTDQLVDENLDAVVTDADDTHLNGGTMKFNVTFTDGQYEVLDIKSVGDGAGEIRRTGSNVYYEGNLIGVVDGTEDGLGTALRINFTTNNATIAAAQALVRSLTYLDTFTLRAPGDRALSLYIQDPAGNANSYNFYIDVQSHPSAPPPGGGPVQAANQLTIVEGQTVALSNENISYADPDNDTITFTVSNVTHGQFELVSNPGVAITTFTQNQVTLGQIAFAHDGSETAPTFSLSASDGTNPATAPAAATITFTNVNDVPVISGTPTTVTTENSLYSFTPTATDGDPGDTLTFSIVNKPSWATFDTTTGRLYGTPLLSDVGAYPNITITVTDSASASDSLAPFTVTVLGDTDGDGVPNNQETTDGTDPNNPNDFKDTDGDGVPDYVETNIDGTDPNDPNDFGDRDGDGVPNYVETHSSPATDPDNADEYTDTDNDGVPDYVETKDGTNPNNAGSFKDTDGDGVPDYVEVKRDGTDPNNAASFKDSDSDGIPDYSDTDNASASGVGEVLDGTFTTAGGGSAGWPLLLLLGLALLRNRMRRRCTILLFAIVLPLPSLAHHGSSDETSSDEQTVVEVADGVPIAQGIAAGDRDLVPFTTVIVEAQDSADVGLFSDWRNRLYLTFNSGYANTHVSEGELLGDFNRAGITANIDSIDGGRAGAGFGAGYRLNTSWAAELEYLDLQEVELAFNSPNTTVDLAHVHPESGKGFTVSGLYLHRVGDNIELRSRLGWFAWSADYNTVRNGSEVDTTSDSATDLYWGFGAGYKMSDEWELNAEFQRFEFDRQTSDYFRFGISWWFDR